MLVPAATHPLFLERALPGGVRDTVSKSPDSGNRVAAGGEVARPLKGPFSHAITGVTLLAAQEAREDPAHRHGPPTDPRELTQEEELEVRRMAARDAEVRRHELAHASVGGPHIGVAEYKYQRGPDGKLYAVGGRVSIDVAPAASPAATVRKMDTIIRAALAPLNPSMEDRAAAVLAWQIRQKAVNAEKAEERDETQATPGAPNPSSGAPNPFRADDDDPKADSNRIALTETAAYEHAGGQKHDPYPAFDLST